MRGMLHNKLPLSPWQQHLFTFDSRRFSQVEAGEEGEDEQQETGPVYTSRWHGAPNPAHWIGQPCYILPGGGRWEEDLRMASVHLGSDIALAAFHCSVNY